MKLILVSQVFCYWLHCLIQDLRIPSFLTIHKNHCLKHHLFTLSTATLLVTLPIARVSKLGPKSHRSTALDMLQGKIILKGALLILSLKLLGLIYQIICVPVNFLHYSGGK